jgi:hypothetical protein
MLGEIDKDFYCSAGKYKKDKVGDVLCVHGNNFWDCERERKRCGNYHRKHPTPEQYKEEYGEDVSDKMPVWYLNLDNPPDQCHWSLAYYIGVVNVDRFIIVIACTPWGKPGDNWRPE